MTNIVDQLKAEARGKPSGVAFRKIKPGLYVSVKLRSYTEMCMNDQYDWCLGDQSITEYKAQELLTKYVNEEMSRGTN